MRASRQHGDWVPCIGWGEQGTALVGDPHIVLLVAAREGISVNSGLVGVVESNDNLLVHRVVGSFHWDLASEDPAVVIHERIVVGILDDDNNFALWADDYNDASQANEPFMWTRVSQAALTGDSNINPAGVVHPYWSVIDTHVKRRLFRDQALFHVTQVVGAGAGEPQLRCTPFLRTYATPGN